ncbi:MAG TPA: cytochrome c biogenesis protein CcdA [Sedimentisphaerales bacterium]|nr:cytochrome c biogenesis protein CcdA [Sedimentisphaerales bacterium]
MEWAKTVLEETGIGPATLPFSFLLGLFSSIASACCTLPILGAIAGYSGTRRDDNRRASLFAALFFMLGTIIATVILGAVAGFIGDVAQATLGKYWKLFAGLIAIFVGIVALKLLPFKLPQIRPSRDKSEPKGFFGAAIFGLVVGGGISVCSMPCNPGILIVLGVAVLQGYTFWTIAILIAYAIGFSLPFAAIMLGVSFGKSAIKAKKAETAIRIIAGVLLIAAGFYFLGTF